MKGKTSFLTQLATRMAANKKPVIYIAGKVTGLPYEQVKQKFAEAKALMELANYAVLNPLDFIAPDADWKEAMRMAIPLLCMADRVFLLKDWRDSEGAVWEFETAVRMGIDVFFEDSRLLS
jgi:hypothetical protein